ncbi:MAG: cadmium-translocating P-type ATPase [Magnetococcus sp. DMHC-1]|nr:cadmium-translocating P-type ATPase [Magnetococcales bacterium]
MEIIQKNDQSGDSLTETTVLHITKMCCPVEADLVRKALAGLDGVVQLDFDFMQRDVVVVHRGVQRAAMVAALRTVEMEPDPQKTGANANLADTGLADADPACACSAPVQSHSFLRAWGLTILAGVSAVGGEILAWSGIDENSPWLIALALVSIASGGLGTLRRGWIALRHLSLNINFLMSLAVLGAMAIGQWPEAAMVIFLFGVAERIEALSLDRARNAVRELMTLAPEIATVQMASGAWESLPAKSVTIGQMVRVKPGERIALDGVVVTGRSGVNQAPITGESVPVLKETGHILYAGSINGSGMLEYRVTADWQHSTLARIIDTIQAAQAKRAPMQRIVDRFAQYYTPAVVGIAVLIATVPPYLFGGAFSEWFYKALVMLVVACPCALVISTPVTVVSGLAAGARRGILIKGGLYLEQAHAIKAIALDKTGTLTQGQLTMTDFIPLGNRDRERTLRLAASLEVHSEHPVAAAIVSAYGKNRILMHVRGFEAIPGRGVRGTLQGELHHLGSRRLLEELGFSHPDVEKRVPVLEQEEKTVVILTSATEPLAIIAVADQMRTHAPEAIHSLHKLGIAVTMLTGDNAATARAIARHAGITDVQAGLLPDEKLLAIEALMQRFGIVAMVGDGINDAPALARASIGIAMGNSGTDTALETADVAIMNDDLRKVGEFVRLGQATRQILWENIILAIGIKGTFLVLSALGIATLWMAVLADMGTSLMVILNGRRLLNFFRPARETD